MPASTRAIEIWAWLLIYAGLGVLSLGLFVQAPQGLLRVALVAAGGVAALAGAALVYVRSKRPDDNPNAKERA